ncbi:MAG: CHAT domain-containing protein, partial [Bacteroidota bacterium]
MQKIGFNGSKEVNQSETSSVEDIVTISVDAYSLASSRGQNETHYVKIDDMQVIEIEYENGIVDFVTAEELNKKKKDSNIRGVESFDDDNIIWIDHKISVDSPDRGIRDIAIKFLRIFKIKDKAAELTVDKVAKKVDEKNVIKEGLFYCEQEAVKLRDQFSANSKSSNDAHLLMIHGFASNTEQSFFGLGDSQNGKAWKELWKNYPNRILAYDHRSITKSPLQNAAELIDSLAVNMTLDILSFSRGGLVSEVIVKAAETDSDSEFWDVFRKCFKGNTDELHWIDQIVDGIKKKRPKIRNFVRVACPAGGTSLASDRLVLYLKILLNAIGLIPAVKAFRPYDHLKGFIIAVARQKGNVKLVPGIAALDPQSALIKGITNLGSKYPITKTPLHVISGDNKIGGLLHTLKVLGADAFFLGKNDFVVDTISMFQGFVRGKTVGDKQENGFLYSFHSSRHVSHFKYFINQDSREAIVIALRNQAKESALFKHHNSGAVVSLPVGVRGLAFDPEKPTVIVIPGIMGSHLEVNNNRVWLGIPELVFGGIDKLEVDAENVRANGAVGIFYNKVCKYLEKSHNVIVHGFDWRLDLLDQVDQFNEMLQKELVRKNYHFPIRIVAHSMGGLLVQALYSNFNNTWSSLKGRPGFRALFFGTPFGGSHAVIGIYLKKHSFFNLLHRIDVTNSSDEVLDIVNRFTGVLQLLPTEKDKVDFFDVKTWKGLQQASGLGEEFTIPDEHDLKIAEKWRNQIDINPIQGKELIYVAGFDELTPSRVEYNDTLGVIKLIATVRGDGTVPWDTGITSAFSQDRIYYMRTKHQSLLSNKSSFPGILDLLEKGITSHEKFSNRPIESRGSQLEYEMPDVRYLAVNNEQDLERTLIGNNDEELFEISQPSSVIDIKVTHGDLGYSDHPLVVGHFEGDKLQGAEWAINKHLNGALQENHSFENYPGKIGESLVVMNDQGSFTGALVVGLGYNERLTEKELESTFVKGLIELAFQKSRDCKDDHVNGNHGVSFLLVGSEYGGLEMLSAVRAILSSVIRANTIIHEKNTGNLDVFKKIEIIELYEEKAIQINKTILLLQSDAEFRDLINVSDEVHVGNAGIVRIATEQEPNWWHRIQITQAERVICNEDSDEHQTTYKSLKFASLSDKARAEVETLFTNKNLIDTLVSQAVKKQLWDPVLSKTLYELLIPNEFKGYADDLKNIRIIVDEHTAVYPWEMLNHSINIEEGPIVVQCGFIRQLYDSFYRPKTYYAQEDRALIIADPIPTPPYPQLPGAREEGRLVRNLFDDVLSNFELEYSEAEPGLEVCKRLFKHEYKIIHIAAHGEYDSENPMNSGLILSDDIRLTPNEIHQMPTVPEFVFINCCHLGAIGATGKQSNQEERHKLAANFGTQFIRNGVKAVIAAGWVVNDKAAKDFARIFYESLLKGDDFGTAVRYARKYCYEQNPGSNTWGAYQCYGNPHYKLTDLAESDNNQTPQIVHKKEVIIALENIARRADAVSSRRSKEASMASKTSRIDQILSNVKTAWKHDSKILEAAGWAYFEIGNFEKARSTYDTLSNTTRVDFSYRSRSNYLISLTSGIVDTPYYENKDQLIAKADKVAESMLYISKHPEVYAVVGGHEKRKLYLADQDQFDETLEKSAKSYQQAYEISQETKQGDELYYLSNLLVMNELLDVHTESSLLTKTVSKNLYKKGVEIINDRRVKSSDFWNMIHEADFQMLRLFLYTNATNRQKEIVET